MEYAYIRPYCLNWAETHDYDVLSTFSGPTELTYEQALAFPRRPHEQAILVAYDRSRGLAVEIAE